MMRARPLSPPLDGPIAIRDALVRGISPERLRRSDLRHPFWGIAQNALIDSSLTNLCHAFATRMPNGAAFSHVTAARLHGMPLPRRLERDLCLDVATPPHLNPIRTDGVRGHRLALAQEDVVLAGGMPVTSPARTWRDLASVLSTEELVVCGDFIVWRQHPKATLEELAAHIVEGVRGVVRLREASPYLTDSSWSPPETRIRFRFAQAGLPRAEPNIEVFDDRGRFLAMPDLAFVRYREIYEYEGDHHRTDEKQWEKDLTRVHRLEDAGWHTTRGSKRDLSHTHELIARMARLLRAKGWAGGPQ